VDYFGTEPFFLFGGEVIVIKRSANRGAATEIVEHIPPVIEWSTFLRYQQLEYWPQAFTTVYVKLQEAIFFPPLRLPWPHDCCVNSPPFELGNSSFVFAKVLFFVDTKSGPFVLSNLYHNFGMAHFTIWRGSAWWFGEPHRKPV